MFFEFDAAKSAVNKDKHGIDFEQAQALWEGTHIQTKIDASIEERFLVTGMIEDKHWSAIITYRGQKIRIISVRRARKEERMYYENQKSKASLR